MVLNLNFAPPQTLQEEVPSSGGNYLEEAGGNRNAQYRQLPRGTQPLEFDPPPTANPSPPPPSSYKPLEFDPPSTGSPPPTASDLGIGPNTPRTGSPGLGGLDDAARAAAPPATAGGFSRAATGAAVAGGLLDFGLRVASGQSPQYAAGGAAASTAGGIVGGIIGSGLGPAGTIAGSMIGGAIAGALYDKLMQPPPSSDGLREIHEQEPTPEFRGGQGRHLYSVSWAYVAVYSEKDIRFDQYPPDFPIRRAWGPIGPFSKDENNQLYVEHGTEDGERQRYYWADATYIKIAPFNIVVRRLDGEADTDGDPSINPQPDPRSPEAVAGPFGRYGTGPTPKSSPPPPASPSAGSQAPPPTPGGYLPNVKFPNSPPPPTTPFNTPAPSSSNRGNYSPPRFQFDTGAGSGSGSGTGAGTGTGSGTGAGTGTGAGAGTGSGTGAGTRTGAGAGTGTGIRTSFPGIPPGSSVSISNTPSDSVPLQMPNLENSPSPVPDAQKSPEEQAKKNQEDTKDSNIQKQLDDLKKMLLEQSSQIAMLLAIPNPLANPPQESLLNPTTFDKAVQTSVCNTTKPGGCSRKAMEESAGNAAKGAENAANQANDTLQKLDLGLLAIINNKLGPQIPNGGIAGKLMQTYNTLTDKFDKLWKTFKLDRIISMLTLAASIHNAAMLSRDLAETLVETLEAILKAIQGWMPDFLKSPDGDDFDLEELLKAKLEKFLQDLLGAENYVQLKATWIRANRILSTAANMLSSIRSMFSAVIEALQTIGKWIALGFNGIQREGLVSDRTWPWMDETPNFRPNAISRFTDNLENVEDAASSIQQLASSSIEFTSEARELAEESQKLIKLLDEKSQKTTEKEVAEALKNQAPLVGDNDVLPAE